MTNLSELDPLIHAPMRLRITSTLAALPPGDALSFTRLRDLLDTTAGNLITHLRKLDDADYIDATKRANTTYYALTPTGRTAYADYKNTLQHWLNQVPTEPRQHHE
ncbi:MAG: transcriptional regulator [Actinomycetota bacterium]